MTRPRRLALALVAVLGLAAAACGDDDDAATATTAAPATTAAATATDDDAATTTAPPATTAAASTAPAASGTITVYTGRNETLVKPLFEQFTQQTGIQVEYRTGDSGELAGQILTEGDKTRADVFFSQDAGALGALAKAAMLAELPQATLGLVPAGQRAVDGTWVGTSGRVRVIVYDPAQVPTPPTGIDGLLDARWKGKLGYAPTNASWQSFVTGLRVLRGEEGARTWLEAFADLDPKAYSGNGAVRDAVNSGEIAMGLINHYYLYELKAKVGDAAVTARNHYLPGDPGGLLNVAGVGVLAASDNAPAALAFVDFLLSKQAQEFFATKTYEFPLIQGVAAVADLPSLAQLAPPAIDLADLSSIEQTQELLANVGLLTK